MPWRAAVGAAILLAVAVPGRAALTDGPRLAAIYDDILNARFERADVELKEACPPAPVEACQALGVVALWWRIQIDPESRLLDGKMETTAESAIEAATQWTRREPQRAEAWFYLAGAYAPLVQWRVLRGERMAAAREGSRIKRALERALALDPTLEDAHFGIGLYHYYADVAPLGAKLLRWLMLLPGGDRVKGLEEMQEAQTRGELLNGEADYQLHFIYLWYEHRPAEALALLESLEARYPFNPVFLQRIAEVHDTYFHDVDASAAAWETLVDRGSRDDVFGGSRIAERARTKLHELRARTTKR